MINNPTIIKQSQSSLVTFSKCTNNITELESEDAKTIVPTNIKRIYAVFVNNSSTTITLILGEPNSGAVDKGITLNPDGGSFEINLSNLYRGKVSAISAIDAKLSWVECEV